MFYVLSYPNGLTLNCTTDEDIAKLVEIAINLAGEVEATTDKYIDCQCDKVTY